MLVSAAIDPYRKSNGNSRSSAATAGGRTASDRMTASPRKTCVPGVHACAAPGVSAMAITTTSSHPATRRAYAHRTARRSRVRCQDASAADERHGGGPPAPTRRRRRSLRGRGPCSRTRARESRRAECDPTLPRRGARPSARRRCPSFAARRPAQLAPRPTPSISGRHRAPARRTAAK